VLSISGLLLNACARQGYLDYGQHPVCHQQQQPVQPAVSADWYGADQGILAGQHAVQGKIASLRIKFSFRRWSGRHAPRSSLGEAATILSN